MIIFNPEVKGSWALFFIPKSEDGIILESVQINFESEQEAIEYHAAIEKIAVCPHVCNISSK